MSLDDAILGFLNYSPLPGYDLKKVFDGSVRHLWPADQSQIYRTLARLAEKGLVEQVYDQIPQAAGTDDPALGPPRERFFWQLTLAYGMTSAHADLVWLESFLARLRAGGSSPAPNYPDRR